ncbi:MAG: activator of HSP90 ATPase [Acidimicrobiales bacterium]|jgi:activator of HSP90 ATPase
MTNRIQQTESISAPPNAVYELLTSSEQFAAMTGGAPAEIDATEGGAISLFGGMITGRNIELVPGQRIVQAWRPNPWDAGVYSLVCFSIEATDEGSSVSLDQSSFPDGEGEHLAQGWHDNYWNNMRTALA